MIQFNPKFITDSKGKKVSVILPIKSYNEIIEELEELEDIKLYHASKSNTDKAIPIEEAFKEIEQNRNTISAL